MRQKKFYVEQITLSQQIQQSIECPVGYIVVTKSSYLMPLRNGKASAVAEVNKEFFDSLQQAQHHVLDFCEEDQFPEIFPVYAGELIVSDPIIPGSVRQPKKKRVT